MLDININEVFAEEQKKAKTIERPSMDETYLKVAQAFSERSSCLRRGYGAVAVKDGEIIATGYNGGYRGGVNCNEIGYCERDKQNIPPGERYELCRGIIHAEMNICQQAKRTELKDSVLYLYGIDKKTGEPVEVVKPCSICESMLKNAQVKKIVSWRGGKIVKETLK